MKIKQAAEQTGLTEKNIRFYEQEGLLQPGRKGTYREYTEQDIERLKQIKLLRKLGVSIGYIRRTLQGDITLKDCIDLRREELKKEAASLKNVDAVCKELLETSTRLDGLPVERYLGELERREAKGGRFIDIVYDYATRAKNIFPTPAFWFEPDDPVLTRQDFTKELIAYCEREKKSLEIIHEGMEPVAYIDGKKYLCMLEQPRMLHLKGIFRVLFPCFVARSYGFKFVYAYPYQ